MCVSPRVMSFEGLRYEIACRNCWQCRENYVADWVGRCIAENESSAATVVVTLTYGSTTRYGERSGDLGAAILIYSDVQKWLKRIRKAGYKVRYFITGEKGSLKGRVHWHCVLFFQQRYDDAGNPIKSVPNFMNRVPNYKDDFWHHGFAFWDADFDPATISYVCKYILKDSDSETFLRMSRMPPLGHDYFAGRAKLFVDQGILPKDAFYGFPDYRGKDGLPRQFMMSGVTLDNFLSDFVRLWIERYKIHPLDVQHSDFLQEWCDAQAARPCGDNVERREFVSRPLAPPHFAYSVSFDDRLNTYVAVGNGERLLWRKDGGEFKWILARKDAAVAAVSMDRL